MPANEILARLKRIASDLGALVSAAFWRQKIGTALGRSFDARHGVETGRVVPVGELTGITAEAAGHAVQYEPSAIPKFRRAMRALPGDLRRFTFVDFGSGKGRVLLLAARYPFKRVLGVEVAPALHAAALANLAQRRRRQPLAAPVECLCKDARELAIPDGPLVLYFYNPFDEAVTAQVWMRVEASLGQDPREVFVIYINPVHRRVFDGATKLRRVLDEDALVVYTVQARPAGVSGMTRDRMSEL